MKDITKAYNNAKHIIIDDTSRFVIMSDVHRGTGGKSDDFLKNKDLFLFALKNYYENEHSYIELGDGEELWENRRIGKIINAHMDVYSLLKKFHEEKRLYLIFGNHDMDRQNKKFVEDNLQRYYDDECKACRELFEGIDIHESIIMNHQDFEGDIFLLHGHQADFFNNELWYLARFLLRALWKPLEYLGVQDPTRPAKAYKKKLAVEKNLTEWIIENKKFLIAGHTHKPIFSDFDVPPYFNDGCCVAKSGITAIEIEQGNIALVKWKRLDSVIEREIVAGPEKLKKYFE